MNRRTFLKPALTALAGFTVLPAATTYARKWKATASGLLVADRAVINPAWVSAPYEAVFVGNPTAYDVLFIPKDFYGAWRFVDESHPLRFERMGDTFRPVEKWIPS